MLSLPVVLFCSAPVPLAVLSLPVVLLYSAQTPLAVLSLPVVLCSQRADAAGRVVAPVVLSFSAPSPLAVLSFPVVLLASVSAPMAVFRSGRSARQRNRSCR